MRLLKLKNLALAIVAAGLTYAYANPAFAVCALANAIPSVSPENTKLLEQARHRIATAFGQPQANPEVVFWASNSALSLLNLNAFGTTQFIGPRACVIIGPKGSNLDVVAHELMHAELFDRIGFWIRMTELPVWFDEGVAMQVDMRTKYDFPADEDSSFVRQLTKASQFFSANDKVLTRNYAGSKSEVRKWLDKGGAPKLYSTLEQLRMGSAFNSLVN